ncbi:MAG: hypothetical protein M3371_06575 [Acidobacteriota bacterium]|nr:hypothetical protein [Acidobacteriota bacterium]
MPLPPFDAHGDLPAGVHQATLAEVISQFGHGTPQRQLVTPRLKRIYELARRTGKLERFVIFGSYVTAKLDPNDVDIILIMRDDFREHDYTEEVLPIFNHLRAQRELGASIFWTRPGAVLLETVDSFLAHWQVKRDLSRQGIVEVIPEGQR